MEQNKTYPNTENSKNEDFAKLQEWFYMCVNKWHWFLISFFVVGAIAVFYVMTTTPTYTRKASILIKDDDAANSLSKEFGAFSDMALGKSRTNIQNEMITLKSTTYMREVVQALHLDMNYTVDGGFHTQVIYGKDLPVNVVLPDVAPDQSARLTVKINGNSIELSEFSSSQAKDSQGKVVTGKLGTPIQTPIGKVIVTPTKAFVGKYDLPIHVTKTSVADCANKYCLRLNVDLNQERASVVDLTLDDESPERAEDVLNTLFEVYNKKWVEDINQQATSTSQFIDEELRLIESELGIVDQDISSFKSEHLIPNLQQASGIYMNKVESTGAQLLELNNQLFMAKYVKNQLNDGHQYKVLPVNSGINNTAISQQIANYNEMVLQRNNLVANSSESNPLVQDLDKSLAATKQAINASVENVIATLSDHIGTLSSSEAETKSKIASNPNQEKYLLSVERQQKVKEQLYVFLLQKREENQLSKAFTAYNTKMLNPPAGSKFPTKPLKKNLGIIAFVISLLIPMLIIFIICNVDTTIRFRKDIESLSLPFLGELPLSYKKRGGILGLFFKHKDVRTIVVQEKNNNAINEAFRVLRTNLEFVTGKDGKNKRIMFTSSNAGSGKTFISMNLATSFAIKGKRILVIDLDLRKASLSTFINSPTIGISNYLSENIDDFENIIVRGKSHPNLDVIPVGTIPPNPTEILFSERLEHLLDSVQDKYDYIFIDCPPLEIVADASILNNLIDMTVFVIRSGHLDKSILPNIEKFYVEKRYKNMVLILNGIDTSSSTYGYNYGYGYGYGYGK
ncbi:MAG: polysaccharide biosynthesis tyrosine autokinase [Bacteroidales bacterium]|nr:polysaccharide biosynthesis tyrosine autokinase [Bacteroidales bacterium]